MKINDILRKHNLKSNKVEIKGKTTIVDTDNGKFVIKEKERNNEKDIFKYLEARNFNYYPTIIKDDDTFITEYIEEIPLPEEQKIMDMIDLVALLHSKTSCFKELDLDDYKMLYEDIKNNIVYLRSYYDDYITTFESKVFMSPSEYLFSRNVSEIYASLNFCEKELETWYELIKEKRKQRHVVLHNNLELSHFLKNKNSYLISWDKAKMDIPIFDLYKMYLHHALDYDFSELLKRYENTYPLLEEEKKLFFILIALPLKIEFTKDEYKMCEIISKEFDRLFKTDNFISPYYTKE